MGDATGAGPSSSVANMSTTTKIPDLDSHLRTIILGLETASTGTGGKVPWTLPDKTKAALVAKAQQHLNSLPQPSLKKELVNVKECWTPETTRTVSDLDAESQASRSHKNGVGGSFRSDLQRAVALGTPHSTISMLTWPQRYVPWWSVGKGSEGDAASIVSKDEEDRINGKGGKKSSSGCGRWCPVDKKTVFVFLLGMLTGAFFILFSLAYSDLDLEVDDTRGNCDRVGGTQTPVPAGLVGNRDANLTMRGRSPRNIPGFGAGRNLINGTGKHDVGLTSQHPSETPLTTTVPSRVITVNNKHITVDTKASTSTWPTTNTFPSLHVTPTSHVKGKNTNTGIGESEGVSSEGHGKMTSASNNKLTQWSTETPMSTTFERSDLHTGMGSSSPEANTIPSTDDQRQGYIITTTTVVSPSSSYPTIGKKEINNDDVLESTTSETSQLHTGMGSSSPEGNTIPSTDDQRQGYVTTTTTVVSPSSSLPTIGRKEITNDDVLESTTSETSQLHTGMGSSSPEANTMPSTDDQSQGYVTTTTTVVSPSSSYPTIGRKEIKNGDVLESAVTSSTAITQKLTVPTQRILISTRPSSTSHHTPQKLRTTEETTSEIRFTSTSTSLLAKSVEEGVPQQETEQTMEPVTEQNNAKKKKRKGWFARFVEAVKGYVVKVFT